MNIKHTQVYSKSNIKNEIIEIHQESKIHIYEKTPIQIFLEIL